MPNALIDLRRFQTGMETTAGTAVSATLEHEFNQDFSFARPIEMQTFEDQVTGTRSARRIENRIVRHMTEVVQTGFLNFDQIVVILRASVRGGITPATPSTPVSAVRRVWTFTDQATADPAIDHYTLRYGDSDGSTTLGWQATYGFVNEWTVSAAVDSEPTISATWRARRATTAALTGSLAGATANAFANRLWIGVTDDSSWANATGASPTAVTGVFRNFTITWSGGPMEFDTADLRRDQDFSSVVDQANHMISVTGEVVLDPTSTSWYSLHRGYKGARMARYMGFVLQGDDRDSGFPRELRVIARMQHEAGSLETSDGTEADGQQLVPVNMTSISDGTNHVQIVATV